MDTYGRIGNLTTSSGCEFLGVADLAKADQFIREQGGVTVAGFPKAIHAYEVINERLNSVASQVAGILQGKGYRALPIPASASIDEEGLYGAFSHKLAAHLAGLGWIGKCCLLVTPQVGPRVRWISILTDAPLPATGGPTEEKCKSCTECIDICPVQAFTGRRFLAEEPRSARYDAARCSDYYKELETDAGSGVCGLCLYVCPFGRKRANHRH
jgi:epoxyqueuosine reductase QueG